METQTETVAPSASALSPADLLETLMKALDDNKAEDIISIDLAGKSGIADHMIIASGRSQRQVAALADYALKALKEKGVKDVMVEGLAHADWVLIDAGDVIAHIFRPEVRSFYNLDKLWAADQDTSEVPQIN